MKILCQNVQHNNFRLLANNLQVNNEFAVIQNMNEIAKALNDFVPNLILLESKYINGLVKAFCDKHGVKIIAFGETAIDHADIFISTTTELSLADMTTLNYKDNVDKLDISVFLDHDKERLYVDFLCNNYDVKSYGNIKINSPKYLGILEPIDKYEILNRSKVSVVFDKQYKYMSALLDCYPIVHGEDFNNIISLMDKLDNLGDIQHKLNDIKKEAVKDSSLSYTIEILNKLGFLSEAQYLNEILEGYIK
jgi:hypothetical protein